MLFSRPTGYVAGSFIAFAVVGLCSALARADEQSGGTVAPANKTITNWQVDDLVGDLDRVREGRSFEAGKKTFDAALCATCHRMNNQGGDLGPDLSKPPQKGKREGIDLLRAILEPSKDVDEKYQVHLVITDRGQAIAGIITERGDDAIRLRTRPVGSETEKTIPRDQIVSIDKVDISIMPDGLVNALSREQILDLLAYIESRGDPQSSHFRGSAPGD